MHQRQIYLLDLLQSGKIDLRETAKMLGVSEMTIRRDFRELEARQLLIQVKGGAIPYPVKYAPDAELRKLNELKFLLAKQLFLRLCPCSSMFIGTGSTCLALAQTIARSKTPAMTIITHSLSVASVLFRTRHKVILLGGELRSTSMDLLGPVSEKNLQEYQVEWLVSGCDGAIANRGFYTSDVKLASLEKKSISISRSVAIITESGKFGRRSWNRFAQWNEISLLVTDSALPEDARSAADKCGIQLLLVPVPEN